MLDLGMTGQEGEKMTGNGSSKRQHSKPGKRGIEQSYLAEIQVLRAQAEAEMRQAEACAQRAEEEMEKAREHARRAEVETKRARTHTQRARELSARLRAPGIDP